MTLYKVTDEQGGSIHGGTGRWTPGRWRSVSGELEPCRRGLHLCRAQDLVHWLGPVIWEAEAEGELIETDDKVVARRARIIRRVDTWDERTARLFACWCAEQALPYALPAHRETLAETIRVVRAYAEGQATDAAWSAARSAQSAAESAARSAARSAAWSAARSAAESAAEFAAWAAAESAAWAAAESAAWSAARSAAWSAAESAAWAVAESAAWSAARSAAWSAARSAQTEYLCELLGIDR